MNSLHEKLFRIADERRSARSSWHGRSVVVRTVRDPRQYLAGALVSLGLNKGDRLSCFRRTGWTI
jgi:hypothetical protein